MKKRKDLRSHFGIFILLLVAVFLLFTPQTVLYQRLTGIFALVWAMAILRINLGREGFLKKIEDTEYGKQIEKDKKI